MCESFSSFVGRTVHKLLLSLDLTTSENFESEKLFVREKKPVVYSDIKTKKNTMHRLVKSICKCTCQMLPRSNTKFVWIINKMCNSQKGDFSIRSWNLGGCLHSLHLQWIVSFWTPLYREHFPSEPKRSLIYKEGPLVEIHQ